MDCPTCSAPNQTSGRNCRKCGVLVISFGAPSAAAPKAPSLSAPGLGTLVLVALLGWAAYAIWWPKPQDVSPQPSLHGRMDWTALLHPGSLIDRAKLMAKATGAREKADEHTNAMVHELEDAGVATDKDIGAESAAPQAGAKNPQAAADATNAQTKARVEELSKIDAGR